MGSRKRSSSGARHPRSPLPRQQDLRERLQNVQRRPAQRIPAPPSPVAPIAPGTQDAPAAPATPGSPRARSAGGILDAMPAARTRPMYAFSRGYCRVQ